MKSVNEILAEVQGRQAVLLGEILRLIVTHEMVLRPWDDDDINGVFDEPHAWFNGVCSNSRRGTRYLMFSQDIFFNPLNVMGTNWHSANYNDQAELHAKLGNYNFQTEFDKVVNTYLSGLWEFAFELVNRPDIAAKLRDIIENGL